MELNPNHPVTATLHDQWHKVAGILLAKLGLTAVEVTAQDIEALERAIGPGGAVVADARGGRFVVRLVHEGEAQRLAREAGGLPS